ncbi:dihydrofolate reductase [Nocardioides marinisabuli]|uniref:Dihydrofolate reductase n=1 Tax=Nocardioides marinisabuli TaxID=419476 RepID=A0A7Y9EXJ7_9ACTN|nr:dihydrofolate reductase family protein [Nocardioides marinisabuli]NYD55772.1 dihydrofolate reductase [Nocardioides marinisabuli]
MRRLIYSMNTTLDGYVATRDGDIGWGVPGPELHQWFNDRARDISVSLYGRRLWEVMSAHWPTADRQPDVSPVEAEFARIWQRTPKVVFSSTLSEVSGNARLCTGDAVSEIARLKAEDGGPMEIGGAGLAGAAMRAGLVDEYQVLTHPVLVGSGTPFFTPLDSRVHLRLVATRTFPGGVTLSHYEAGH